MVYNNIVNGFAQELSFKAKSPSETTKKSSSDLAKLKLQGIEAHGSKTFTEQLTIPNSLMFSNLKHCGIITDNYVLKVSSTIIYYYKFRDF